MNSTSDGNSLFRIARLVGRYTLALAAGGLFVWLSWNSQPHDTLSASDSVLLNSSGSLGDTSTTRDDDSLAKPAGPVSPGRKALEPHLATASGGGPDSPPLAGSGNISADHPSTGPPSE
ncbi:MAG: hypothetical protein KF841_02510 [Phycisphaerae bacterium]|nr:hypothetical protein [Phycisphaerae bacterium]